MKTMIVYDRPPRNSVVAESRWSISCAVKQAKAWGADVYRSGRGFRIEFDNDSDGDEFADRLLRGGFRVAEP
jgi:hypothetical protein